MATYTDRLLVLSSAGIPTRIAASDTIELSLGNLVIGGDLTVKGDRIVNQSETVLLADNHTYVNAGYTSTVAQTGGLVVNYLPTATATTCTGYGVFTAGVDGSSDPMVTTAGEAVFAAGDFIQVSGSVNGNNDGLYEVLSHVGHDLKIRSTLNGASGASDQVMDFTDGQFQALTDTSAVITKVNISVLRAGTDGIWESAYGANTTGFTFIDVASTAGSTLQAVYESGNTIDADATDGDIAFTVDSVDFTVDGSGTAGSVLFGQTTALASFEADASGAISFSAGASSDFTVTSGNLDLSASDADINIDAYADLDLDGDTVHMNSVGQMDVLAGGLLNIGSTGGNVAMGAVTGSVVIGSAKAASDALQLQASDAAAGGIDIYAGGGGIDAYTSASVSIEAGASSDFTVTGDLDLSASADLDLDGATVHMDSSGQMDIVGGNVLNMSATLGDLTVDAVAGSLILDSGEAAADAVRIVASDAAGGIDIDAGTGGIDAYTMGNLELGADGTIVVKANGHVTISSFNEVPNPKGPGVVQTEPARLYLDSAGSASLQATTTLDLYGDDVNVNASYDLDLDGYVVHIDSYTQMDIAAGADLNMSAVGDLDLDGATVHMDSSGQMDIASGADLNMSAVGDLDLDGATVHVDSSGQMDIASGAALNVDAVGALSLGAGASSDFTVTGDLDLSASADLDLDGATVHVDAAGQMDVAAGADLNMSAVGDLDLDAATVHMDSSGQMDIASGADLNLSAYANLDLDGASVDIDASGAVSIGAGASSDFTVTGDLDLSASVTLDLDGASVEIDASAAFSIDGAAASNVSVTGADLTVSTITSGNLILNSAGDLDFDAVGSINFASGGNSIDINPGDDSIDVSAVGAFGVAAQSASFIIADDQASAFLVEDAAGVDYLKVVTTDSSEEIVFGNATTNPAFDFAGTGVVSMDALYVSKHAKFEEVAAPSNVADHGFVYVKADGSDSELFFYGDHAGAGLEVQITKDGFLNVQAIASSEFVAAAGGVSAGDALYIASATEVGLADATTADGKNYVVGFAKASAAGAATVAVAALPGAVVATGSIVGFASAGQAVYLSETAGVVTVTAPTASGSTVYKVGYALTSTSILFQPQLVAINP
jgi:hypothetical protein